MVSISALCLDENHDLDLDVDENEKPMNLESEAADESAYDDEEDPQEKTLAK
jgi:hypothetical protein